MKRSYLPDLWTKHRHAKLQLISTTSIEEVDLYYRLPSSKRSCCLRKCESLADTSRVL